MCIHLLVPAPRIDARWLFVRVRNSYQANLIWFSPKSSSIQCPLSTRLVPVFTRCRLCFDHRQFVGLTARGHFSANHANFFSSFTKTLFTLPSRLLRRRLPTSRLPLINGGREIPFCEFRNFATCMAKTQTDFLTAASSRCCRLRVLQRSVNLVQDSCAIYYSAALTLILRAECQDRSTPLFWTIHYREKRLCKGRPAISSLRAVYIL